MSSTDDYELESALSSLSAYRRSPTIRDALDSPGSSWNDESEDTLQNWKLQCQGKSLDHFHLGCFYHYVSVLVAFPTIVLPAVSAQLNKLDEALYGPTVEFMLMFSTLCSGIISVFNLGRRSQQHFHVDQQLSKVVKEVDVELRKPRKARQPSEYFIVTTMFKIEGVLASAPGDGCSTNITKLLKVIWSGCKALRPCKPRGKA